MAEIVYPSRFARAVLAGEAPGGEPAAADIVAPTIAACGEPLRINVALRDEMGYPSVEFDGKVVIECEAGTPGRIEIAFSKGQPAVATVEGVVIEAEGLHRFDCRLGESVFHSNPICIRRDVGERIYWGDPHVHTALSDCVVAKSRSLNFCYIAAKWFAGLDWVTAADHVSWGRCSRGKWRDQAAASDAFDEPGRFVTLPGYEASLAGGAGGDNNVYMTRWPEMYVDEWDGGDTRTICAKLAEALGEGEFFIAPHHTTRDGKHGEISDDIYPGPELMPVVEIHSKWGTSEYRGNPGPLLEIHPGPSYVVDLLNAGLPLGFVGGTDAHSTMPAGFGDDADHICRLPGMTAVRTGELTRRAIFDGVRSRNCYAASGERVYLAVSVAGAEMGRIVEWSDPAKPRTITASAAGASDVSVIEIIRNGETIAVERPGDWRAEIEFEDAADMSDLTLTSKYIGRFVYYYVRVTCASGAQAWSSPVWLTLGE